GTSWNVPLRGSSLHEEVETIVREEVVEDEGRLDLLGDVVDVPIRVLSEVPPDDPVVLVFQGPQRRFADVDAPPIGNEAEAHVERDCFRTQLEHAREGGRIFRDVRLVRGQRLRGELERTGALEQR